LWIFSRKNEILGEISYFYWFFGKFPWKGHFRPLFWSRPLYFFIMPPPLQLSQIAKKWPWNMPPGHTAFFEADRFGEWACRKFRHRKVWHEWRHEWRPPASVSGWRSPRFQRQSAAITVLSLYFFTIYGGYIMANKCDDKTRWRINMALLLDVCGLKDREKYWSVLDPRTISLLKNTQIYGNFAHF